MLTCGLSFLSSRGDKITTKIAYGGLPPSTLSFNEQCLMGVRMTRNYFHVPLRILGNICLIHGKLLLGNESCPFRQTTIDFRFSKVPYVFQPRTKLITSISTTSIFQNSLNTSDPCKHKHNKFYTKKKIQLKIIFVCECEQHTRGRIKLAFIYCIANFFLHTQSL